MSALATVHPIHGQQTFKSVEIARRREVDTWDLADAVYEDVLALVPDPTVVATTVSEGGAGNGRREAEDVVYDAHRSAGTEIGRTYLRAMFDTVRVWPPDERVPDLASFVVHSELRGKDFPNRRQVIERLASKSKTGRVTWSDLRRWKSERKPVQQRTFLELVERRLRSSLRDVAKPWHSVTQSDRESIARMLRLIAEEVQDGRFTG